MRHPQPVLAEIDREFGTTVTVPRLLDRDRIAALVGLHPDTIGKMVKAGTFPPPLLIEGSQRWDAREYNAWVEARPRMASGEQDVPRGRPRKHG